MAESALLRAKTISLENQDPAVLLIFLELWLLTLLQYRYHLDAEAIYSLVKSLQVKDVPLEIEIIPSKCEYIYCAFTGKLFETEIQIKKIMQKVKGVESLYKN